MTPTTPKRDWDVILVTALFIAGCLAVSLLLPRWQPPRVMKLEPIAVAASPAAAPQTPIDFTPTPQQQRAAVAAYHRGMDALQAARYGAAATEFKTALEKYPAFTEAYAGLAEAAIALGQHQAAALNAQHALDLWRRDKSVHVTGLATAAAEAWAHRLLGAALLDISANELRTQQLQLGHMNANRALFHCRQALLLNQADAPARACARSAAELLMQL